jgi:hypothetical protein
MRNYLNIIVEVIIIGFLTTFFTFGIYTVMNGEFPQSTKPGYKQMIIGSFLVGALLHISFEFSGINEKWCKTTYML